MESESIHMSASVTRTCVELMKLPLTDVTANDVNSLEPYPLCQDRLRHSPPKITDEGELR